MSEQDFTWIIVADGVRARVLEERLRGGQLHELAEHAMHDKDHHHATHAKATGQSSFGSGRHNVNEADSHSHAENSFLRRVADMADQAATSHGFAHLVLIAPPKALGELKAALKPSTARLIALTDAHERTAEDAAALRSRLHHLRTF